MQVSEAIGNEATFFLVSMLCGMGLVLTYDFFRIIRRLIPHGNIWIGIEDVCYWIFGTVVVFLLLYQKNDGMLRAFCFLGIALGGIIYAFLFSRFVVKIFVWVLGTIGKPFVKPGKKIIIFIKKIMAFIRKRLKKLYKAIKIGLCKL